MIKETCSLKIVSFTFKQKHHAITCLLVVAFCFVYAGTHAQKPQWAVSYGGQTPYSTAEYYTGFGMATNAVDMNIDQLLAQVESNARQNLIEKIRVQVQSMTSYEILETDEAYSSRFLSLTQSRSSMELYGVQTQTHFDNSEFTAYALANISGKALHNQLSRQFQQQSGTFNRLVDNAVENEKAGRTDLAFAQFSEAKTTYNSLSDTWLLLQSVERNMQLRTQSDELLYDLKDRISLVDRQIDHLLDKPLNSLEDVAWRLARILGNSCDEAISVGISAITYRDLGIGSEFANYLGHLLAGQLSAQTSWVVQDINRLSQVNPGHMVTGTFWDRGNEVHILLNTRNIENGQLVAAAEAKIAKQVIDNSGLAFLPDNYETAIADIKALQSGEQDSRGLQLEAWTNRGEKNLVFEENDIMEISLQVNLPAYIRILYHLKDGRRVLLLDNHYINPRDVNKPYHLPYRFQCVPPFGVENMQVIAQSEPFERLQTREVDGMPMLVEDLDKFLANIRGFIMIKEEVQQTEKILTITTMPRKN